MIHALNDDPIIALSSGSGRAAIALLRLTSPQPFEDLRAAFSFQGDFRPREAITCRLLHGKCVLDQIVLTYFPAPNSYTGEFVLELSVHGNPLNVGRILRFFQDQYQLRLAFPGEFTYRALKHGKLTLSQVEGLDLLLNAQSELGLASGLEGLQGELHQRFLSLREAFISLAASLELAIDFSDDVGEEESRRNFNQCLKQFELQLHILHQRCRGDLSSLLNPSVVLLGKTNAGKSTLFNRLLNTGRSLVSNEEGTTRDYISEFVFTEGTHFQLIDTAGIRKTGQEIEKQGIEKALDLAKKAFYTLYVCNPFQATEGSLVPEGLKADGIVFTHADCEGFCQRVRELDIPVNLETYLSAAPMGAGPETGGSIGAKLAQKLKTAPIEPLCIESLWGKLGERYREKTACHPIASIRQEQKIKVLYHKLLKFKEVARESDDICIVSNELNLLAKDVDELVGIVSPDDVLKEVFANFCVGK